MFLWRSQTGISYDGNNNLNYDMFEVEEIVLPIGKADHDSGMT